MEYVLVTGGAGFIGSHIVDNLIQMKQKVIIIDDLSGGFIENINKKAILINASITDCSKQEDIFKEYTIKYIFHLAAYAAEGLSHFIRNYNYNNNVIGSINLINMAVNYNIKCFVFTSSIAVYGSGQLPYNEETIPQPEDPYGIAKYAIELDLKCAFDMFELNSIIFRPHNVYGERQNIGDKYRNVIGIFMNNIMQDKQIPIFGDGNQTRAFSYISDVAKPIANSIFIPEAYNQVFNIGADKPYSINQLVEHVTMTLNVSPKIKYYPPRKEVLHAFSNHEKSNKIFSQFIRHIPLSDGLQNMIDWVKRTGIKRTKNYDTIEINKNLPSLWL